MLQKFGIISKKKVIVRRLDFLGIIQLECWSNGVLECCKRKNQSLNHYSITPSLHYSNAPKIL